MIVLKLKEVLDKKNISEKQLKAVMNKNTVNSWLRNQQKRIDYNVLNQLCSYLNCQPGELIEYIPDEKKDSLDSTTCI